MPESMSERQNLRPHTGPTKSESDFQQDPLLQLTHMGTKTLEAFHEKNKHHIQAYAARKL